MNSPSVRSPNTAALRLARQAWRLLYTDSRQCLVNADLALGLAIERNDAAAQGRARLARGFHLIWYSTPAAAMRELHAAQACFDIAADRAGFVLAEVGIARALWRAGEVRQSLERVLPLRDEGLRILKHDERGMLLNTIAGCYSADHDSQQAFAYMYQAMRESSKTRRHGLDVVLHCNLAHELIHLGDYPQALSYVQEGMVGCLQLDNPRLLSVLRINRVICLTSLDRPAEAMADVHHLLQLPADSDGRGPMDAQYETLAIAAVRAGDLVLGADLIRRAEQALATESLVDERLTLVVARAELLLAQGQPALAIDCLVQPAMPAPHTPGDRGNVDTSLQVRCMYLRTLADAHERLGDSAQALAAMRAWQGLHIERSMLASTARYQAFALQVELLRMKLQLGTADAQRRQTEHARVELEAANRQLQRKVAQVEALQQALKQQATRDFLTGLFNRRHLDDVLPSMLAMAHRDRQPLAVVIIDLDHFKHVNDSLGHAAGDRLLARFGELLLQHCRASDVACRYGGEEFCLLMPRTLASSARRKTQALLRLWSGMVGEGGPGLPGAMTFSAGVADSQGTADGATSLLEAADAALLQAKRMGRNRVQVHDAGTRAAA